MKKKTTTEKEDDLDPIFLDGSDAIPLPKTPRLTRGERVATMMTRRMATSDAVWSTLHEYAIVVVVDDADVPLEGPETASATVHPEGSTTIRGRGYTIRIGEAAMMLANLRAEEGDDGPVVQAIGEVPAGDGPLIVVCDPLTTDFRVSRALRTMNKGEA